MSKTVIIAGVAALGVVGYALASWLAKMTDYAERRDAESYLPHPAPPAGSQRAGAPTLVLKMRRRHDR